MFYLILKLIFKVALRVFFRRIDIRNKHLIPASGPLLIASNHPNTFMDPIAIAAVVKQEVYFIAKSTLFNSAFNKWFLHKMNLIPVYRSQDGASIKSGNDQTFRKCIEFLGQKGTLLIFPEGNSFNERRLRPLKTGTARIALGAEAQMAFQAGIKILPLGLNYSDPTQFRSKLYINIGEPIEVAAYAEKYEQDAFGTAQGLTAELKRRLEELVVFSETDEEDDLARQVEIIYSHNLQEAFNLGKRQDDQFILTKGIFDSIRYFRDTEPGWVADIQVKVTAYIHKLKQLGLQDKHLQVGPNQNPGPLIILQTGLYFLAGFPLYIWGILTNYLPYFIPSKIADRLTDEQEFRAPIMMTAGIFTFTVWYAGLIYLFYDWNESLRFALLFAMSLPFSGLFALRYGYRLGQTRAFLKLYSVIRRRPPVVEQLWQERTAIITDLEAARNRYLQHRQSNTIS